MLGSADIADELGTSRSTTHRHVITLVGLGYLEQATADHISARLGYRREDETNGGEQTTSNSGTSEAA